MRTWRPGVDARVEDPAASLGFAEDLAALLTRLRSADARGRQFAGGGFAPADPAPDPVAVRHRLDDGPRQLVREAPGCDDVRWRRRMAWAFDQAMGLVRYLAGTNPVTGRWGRRTLDRLGAARPLR